MNDLTPARIAALLETGRYGRSLALLAETGSTNDDARDAAKRGAPDGHVVVADCQRAGRGSHGRAWSSPAGVDLYVSVVAHVAVPLSALPPLTLAVGLAVADTVDSLTGQRSARIKWPNDVWVAGRKIAGILVEGTSSADAPDPLVIGVGLNVNRLELPTDLETEATSLALVLGAPVDRAAALCVLLARLEGWVDRFVAHGAAPIAQAVSQRLALRGEVARCDGAVGTVEGVAASGALVMRCDGVSRELHAGRLRPVG